MIDEIKELQKLTISHYKYEVSCSNCSAIKKGYTPVREAVEYFRDENNARRLLRNNIPCSCNELYSLKMKYMFEEYEA